MRALNRVWTAIRGRLRGLDIGFPRRRVEKIKNYFRRGFGVEDDVFTELELGIFPPGWEPSLIEMVSVLSVGTSVLTFAEVLAILERFSTFGWIESNLDGFLRLLMETSRAFYGQGWDREAGRLLKVGEICARRHRRKGLEAIFHREIDRRTVSRLREQSFMPQRGQ